MTRAQSFSNLTEYTQQTDLAYFEWCMLDQNRNQKWNLAYPSKEMNWKRERNATIKDFSTFMYTPVCLNNKMRLGLKCCSRISMAHVPSPETCSCKMTAVSRVSDRYPVSFAETFGILKALLYTGCSRAFQLSLHISFLSFAEVVLYCVLGGQTCPQSYSYWTSVWARYPVSQSLIAMHLSLFHSNVWWRLDSWTIQREKHATTSHSQASHTITLSTMQTNDCSKCIAWSFRSCSPCQ